MIWFVSTVGTGVAVLDGESNAPQAMPETNTRNSNRKTVRPPGEFII
jgi:hypothetical protein